MPVWFLALTVLVLWIVTGPLRKKGSRRGPSRRRAEPAADARRGIPTRRERATAPSAAPTEETPRAPRAVPDVQPREGTRRPSDRAASHAGSRTYARRSVRPDS